MIEDVEFIRHVRARGGAEVVEAEAVPLVGRTPAEEQYELARKALREMQQKRQREAMMGGPMDMLGGRLFRRW